MYFLTTFNGALHINILDRKIINISKLLERNQITKMQALIRHLRCAVCYIFSSASLGGTEEYCSGLIFSYNYESNGFIVIIKDLPIMTYDKSYS